MRKAFAIFFLFAVLLVFAAGCVNKPSTTAAPLDEVNESQITEEVNQTVADIEQELNELNELFSDNLTA